MTVEEWLVAQQREHNLASFQVPLVVAPKPRKPRKAQFRPTDRHMEIAIQALAKREEA